MHGVRRTIEPAHSAADAARNSSTRDLGAAEAGRTRSGGTADRAHAARAFGAGFVQPSAIARGPRYQPALAGRYAPRSSR
jgi:hypothetical protein